MATLYITGAGVSAESGIPTFRGEDGFWTIGSRNYTPQEMATRAMYEQDSLQFLRWYY
ncbi:Sir2 family NAD-dependent protein deacetylase, partial [Congregibacter sp.]